MLKRSFIRLFEFKGVISIIFYIAFIALLWKLIIPHTSIYYRTNIYDPLFRGLNVKDITLVKGEEFRLRTYRLNQRVSYSSTDFKVASVNFLGTVTALRPGVAIIKVKYNNTELKCRVRVIAINKKKIVVKKSTTYRLRVLGTLSGVRWYSSDASIATVNRFGKVKARSKGTTVIYAKVKGKTLRCTVVVK